jgi:hypothetical protein
MSMIGNFIRLPETELDALLSAPDSIMDFLYPDDDSRFANDRHLDVDKAWHIIHFLLNGTAWDGEPPLFNVVLGGAEIGEVDVGYGPARYLRPSEVGEVSEALRAMSQDALWSRFDAGTVSRHEIYPDGWTGSDEERDYVLNYFQRMKLFFEKAAQGREAVLKYLN